MSSQTSQHKEIRYLRFLNNTLQIREIRKDICDEFTRKIFDYVENESLFDAQIFCAFLYEFIFKCKLYQNLVMTAESNFYDKIRLDAGKIVNELSLFLNLWTVKFALSSVDPNQFHRVSIKEKLKHLLDNEEPIWKPARVKIILPEMRGNTGIVPYFDLEFTLTRLSVGQKLDIIHFAICALNYLSQKDEPVYTFSNPELSPIELVSKPEQLKVVSDNLDQVRYFVILNAVREKESDDDEQNAVEFDQNEPTTARIIKAQSQDPKIEEQWLDKNSPVFVKSETEKDEPKDEKTNETVTGGYSIYYRNRIIDAAVRLTEKQDTWGELELIEELDTSKSTLDRQKRFFKLKMPIIRDEANAKIREKKT